MIGRAQRRRSVARHSRREPCRRRTGGRVGWALALATVVVGAAVAAVLLHRNGHTQGDDFALYLRQARSLFDGDIGDVVADNRFSVVNSGPVFSPIAYPWGWPLMLAPFVNRWGYDYDRLKLLEVAAFCIWLVLVHGIVRRRAGRLLAIAVTAVVAHRAGAARAHRPAAVRVPARRRRRRLRLVDGPDQAAAAADRGDDPPARRARPARRRRLQRPARVGGARRRRSSSSSSSSWSRPGAAARRCRCRGARSPRRTRRSSAPSSASSCCCRRCCSPTPATARGTSPTGSATTPAC